MQGAETIKRRAKGWWNSWLGDKQRSGRLTGMRGESHASMMSPESFHKHTSLMLPSVGSMLVNVLPLLASHTCVENIHASAAGLTFRSQQMD